MTNCGAIEPGASLSAVGDFKLHDELPSAIRDWYANAKLLWVSEDAIYWLRCGCSVNQVIAKLEETERRVLEEERSKVWTMSARRRENQR